LAPSLPDTATPAFPQFDRAFSAERLAELREVLHELMTRIERRQHILKVPRLTSQLQPQPAMHYHFKPEVFVQTGGTTEFTTPREKILLRPGELMIIPPGVPHKEFVSADGPVPFSNLVIGFYNKTLSVHFATEVAPGTPDIESIEFFDAPDLDIYVTFLDQIVAAFHSSSPMRKNIVRGLLLALSGKFHDILDTSGSQLNRDIGKIFQVKWLVREQLSHPGLNVKNIAEKLQCSPDYLSHLFRAKTGEKLVRYIQRMRIIAAVAALESTHLYVSEIAWSVGFQDPAYFGRVFRKFMGKSPQDYREELQKRPGKAEPIPKTVYNDREDFSHGGI
jgi:AraC-like DNA-binding protein/mannose-6-phosphate isomerase-like protein (cupin superfamily)